MAQRSLQQVIKHSWARWVQRRIPAQTSVELGQRSIFILPSREGTLFIVALAAMFIGGVNYQNSLIMGLTFFLTGLLLVAILQTFRNLSGINFGSEPSEPGFVDDFVMYTITLQSSKKKYSHESIQIGFVRLDRQTCAVECGEISKVKLFISAKKRGLQKPGRLLVQTSYPLGLLRAWSWVDLKLEGLVYPKPLEGPKPMQGIAADENHEAELKTIGVDDFSGLNSYQPGDPLSRVYWKVLARGLPLATKSFEQPMTEASWLCRDTVTGGLEEQLQVLTFWVLKLTQSQAPFGLDLGSHRIPVNSGEEHKRVCLEALALYGLSSFGSDGSEVPHILGGDNG